MAMSLCTYCNSYSSKIPIVFVLGFYVSIVAARWWDQFLALPWPDQVSLYLLAHLPGPTTQEILYRRNIVRYINASYCLALRSVSSRARLRFPTEEHLVTAGILTSDELELLRNSGPVDIRGEYYIPINWAHDLVQKARKDMLIKSEYAADAIIQAINDFRGCLGSIFVYDWINPPLVYTQTATICVYSYFLFNIFAWQFIDQPQDSVAQNIDIYVAESLINPFGEDDDDFEIEYMIERNLEMSFAIVHGIMQDQPQALKGNLNHKSVLQLPNWGKMNQSQVQITVDACDEEEQGDRPDLEQQLDPNLDVNNDYLFLGSLANFKVPGYEDITPSGERSSLWNRALKVFQFNRSNSR
ncbi:bestrophin [Cichlidogyrus casuarinus]|uniref:Bestrophin homolog n=1 Tax=Cichlidogyrus casuarinus TaxID=1844966 RepID=A0ABD2QIK1_9PLAT